MRRVGRKVVIGAVAAVLILPMSGCGGGGGSTDPFETITSGALDAGGPIPAPAEPILEIGGKITTTNRGERLHLDMATLEQLGLIRYTVRDPWLKRDVSYTGVLLADLVRLARPPDSTSTMHLVALDDYEVEITIADAERWPIMLATRLDGNRMPVANGGPTRIVFPYGLVPGIDELEYKDLWIWNIESITFR